jgi:rhodanese-related sulfurtransferase
MKLLVNLSFFALFFSSCGAQSVNESQSATNGTKENAQTCSCQRVDASTFRSGIASGNVQILDVRTPQERTEGKIEGSININFYDANFREQVNQLDKNIPVYVYCRSGARSQQAMEIMRDLGFTIVYELKGGYMNYNKA